MTEDAVGHQDNELPIIPDGIDPAEIGRAERELIAAGYEEGPAY